jgi:hypothetical protein
MRQGLTWVLLCLSLSGCGGGVGGGGRNRDDTPHDAHNTKPASRRKRARGAGGVWLCGPRRSSPLWRDLRAGK